LNAGLAEVLLYNRWANLTLLEACRSLTDAQLNACPPGVSGSIGELLTHLVGSQQTFVLRTKGRQHEGELGRETAWPGIETLIEIATSTSDELVVIAEAFDDREVVLPYIDTHYSFPLRFFLTHTIEHGAEHRTEVKVGLLQLGIETPDLDGWQWAAAMGYGQEVDAP